MFLHRWMDEQTDPDCRVAVLQFMHPNNKVTGSMCVCVHQGISLTIEPIWFSFTWYLPIGSGKVYNYFWGGYHHHPKRNYP